MSTQQKRPLWQRAIILVDMNAFFCSVEQKDFPELRNKPIVVTNGKQGTCIITSSYEARAYGVKTGMRLAEARRLCPHLIQRPSRPYRYAEISTKIMQALADITPDIEVYSVDEAFLDVTHCQQLYGDPVTIAKLAKQRVIETAGLPCSVGVSGDKSTAKFAAKCQKPDGFTVIYPWEAKERLQQVPVTELWGIASGIGNFLANYGVYYCGDIEKLPIGILAKRFGNLGRRIWYMCQGADPDPVHVEIAAPKSMGHGKVIPPNTRDKNLLLTYLQHMSEKLAARLRTHHMRASQFFVGLKNYELGWIGGKYQTAVSTNSGKTIFGLAKLMLRENWRKELGIYQVQITALDPKAQEHQLDLFTALEKPLELQRNIIIDAINARYGEFTIAPARLLQRSNMPNVIAPSWKPFGHRQLIK